VASSGSSARTASSAARLPWMSYSAATDVTSVGDLELETAARLDPAGADDRAEGTGEPALATDYLADVGFGHVQTKDERAVVLLDLLDTHGVGLVDEPAGELGNELRHGLLDALSLEELRHRLGRLRALLEPAAHLLLVEVDERRIRLRVVAAHDFDELAVARRARIGRDDAVDRVLLRTDARQPELHCHPVTFSLSSSSACCSPCESHSAWASTRGW